MIKTTSRSLGVVYEEVQKFINMERELNSSRTLVFKPSKKSTTIKKKWWKETIHR